MDEIKFPGSSISLIVHGHCLVSAEDVTCIYLAFYVVKATVVTVGNDGIRLRFEDLKVVHDAAAEES